MNTISHTVTEYLVVGLYVDTGQRFADIVTAATPEEAEQAVQKEGAAIDVAAVFEIWPDGRPGLTPVL